MDAAARRSVVDALCDARRVGAFLVARAEVDASFDASPWLDAAPRSFYFARDASTIVAAGVAAELDAHGAARFDELRENARALGVDAAGGALRCVGAFTFFDGASEPPFAPAAAASFFLPRFLFVREGERASITFCRPADEDVGVDAVRAEAEARLTMPPQAPGKHAFELSPDPRRETAYLDAVDAAVRMIEEGRFQKVVLARCADGAFDGAPPPASTIARTLGRAKAPTTRFLLSQHGQIFFGQTPELLCDVRGGRVTTEAVAGTIAGAAPPEALLASDKDRREHAMVVDGIRERLAPLGLDVGSAPAPELRRIGGLTHLVTPLVVASHATRHVLEVVAAMHPTPALGGAPREAAGAFIRDVEPTDRGLYGAPIGWFAPATGEGTFVVGIRSALLAGGAAHLFAGAGIVRGSIAAAELAETDAKLAPMRAILESLA